EQKARYRGLLEARYKRVTSFLGRTRLPASLVALPFNSGYFMSFECVGISAEALRLRLLDKGIGTISMQDRYLRVAFSSVEAEVVDELYAAIAAEAAALSGV
ncbi:MAG: aminotransferase, partial [Spirochaetaceae bacterium]|nr:aminotransferase [Spirochaetaceae bacterium]